MKTHRVFIVGDSLFAETLGQILVAAEGIEVIGSAPTPEAALPLLETQLPEAVIVANVGETPPTFVSQFLSLYPSLPIICADFSMNEVRIITSRRIAARSDDLIKVIRSLPTRRRGG